MIDSPLSSTRAIKINCQARGSKERMKDMKTQPISIQNTHGALSEKNSEDGDSGDDEGRTDQKLKKVYPIKI